MSDDRNIVARRPSERTSVSSLLLDVGDHGTFRERTQWQDVSNSQSCVLAGVDELTRVHALVCDKRLGV